MEFAQKYAFALEGVQQKRAQVSKFFDDLLSDSDSEIDETL